MEQLELGRELRDEGIHRVDVSVDDLWKIRAEAAIYELAALMRPFTSEDVRARAGDPPKPNAMGGRFMSAARRGTIVRAGYSQATRAERHASALAQWVGVA